MLCCDLTQRFLTAENNSVSKDFAKANDEVNA